METETIKKKEQKQKMASGKFNKKLEKQHYEMFLLLSDMGNLVCVHIVFTTTHHVPVTWARIYI